MKGDLIERKISEFDAKWPSQAMQVRRASAQRNAQRIWLAAALEETRAAGRSEAVDYIIGMSGSYRKYREERKKSGYVPIEHVAYEVYDDTLEAARIPPHHA